MEEEEKMNEVSMLYGSAMSMMLRHERQVLAEPERMPGLRSSFLCKFMVIKLWSVIWVGSIKSSLKTASIEVLSSRVPMLMSCT